MKKILAISLIAFTAVSTANAQIASKAYVDPAADGTYVKVANSTGANLTALDTQVKANADKFGNLGEQTVAAAITAASNGAAGVTGNLADLDDSFGTGENAPDNLVDAINTTKAEADANETAISNINSSDVMTSGIDSTKVAAIATNTSDIATINASAPMTSGITAAKVSQYDGYATGKQDTLTFDATPTANSTNPVTSGGVQAAIAAANTTASGLDTRLTTAEGEIDALQATIDTETTGLSDRVEAIESSAYATSGIDSSKVAAIATNTSGIATINASAPMTSGITAAKVSQYDGYATGKQDAIGATLGSDGTYVLTANVSNGVVSGYQWELITGRGL